MCDVLDSKNSVTPAHQMIQAQTLSKAQQAYATLGQYLENGTIPDEFTRARLKREANSSVDVDPVGAYIALGLLAAFEWDGAAVKNYLEKALAFTDASVVHANYAVALAMVYEMAASARESRIASELEPSNLSLLNRAVSVTLGCGSFFHAKKLAEIYEVRSPKQTHQQKEVIHQACNILHTRKIDERVSELCNEVAFTLLKENRVSPPEVRYQVDIEDQIIFCSILLDLPFERVMQLDDELTSRLFDAVPEFAPNAYWVGFECQTKNSHEH